MILSMIKIEKWFHLQWHLIYYDTKDQLMPGGMLILIFQPQSTFYHVISFLAQLFCKTGVLLWVKDCVRFITKDYLKLFDWLLLPIFVIKNEIVLISQKAWNVSFRYWGKNTIPLNQVSKSHQQMCCPGHISEKLLFASCRCCCPYVTNSENPTSVPEASSFLVRIGSALLWGIHNYVTEENNWM